MEDSFKRLKQLVLDGGYDVESKKQIAELEARLQDLAVAENIKQQPTIQKFITYLTDTAERCTVLLANDRKLTDLERQALFEKRGIFSTFTSLFDGTEKQAVEEIINHLLDVASSN